MSRPSYLRANQLLEQLLVISSAELSREEKIRAYKPEVNTKLVKLNGGDILN